MNWFCGRIRRLYLEFRVSTWLGLRQYDKALSALKDYVRVSPDKASIWAEKSMCEVLLEFYDDALDSVEVCLRKNPYEPFAFLWKGRALEGKGRLKDALVEYGNAKKHAKDKSHLLRYIDSQLGRCSRIALDSESDDRRG